MAAGWVALSGTPGTGKTRLARGLRANGWRVVDGNRMARAAGALLGTDRLRGSRIVDLRRMAQAMRAKARQGGPVVLESHWSHAVAGAARVVVLRVSPRVVRRRLRRRRWAEQKIEENVEAEAIGIIAGEALRTVGRGRVAELDTTGLSARAVLQRVVRALENPKEFMKLEIGRVDWTEEILGWF